MASTQKSSFEGFAGACAVAAGILGLLYSLGFVVLSRIDGTGDIAVLLYSFSLLLGGLTTSAVMVGLYMRLRVVDEAFALWGLLLGLVGAVGAAIHGGYDLANAINPPGADPLGAANLPFQVDPRGLLTFGVAAVALFVFSWLIVRSGTLPASLGYLGYALAAVSIILYIARLTVLSASSPLIFIPALLAGFLLNPAWYLWLGSRLMSRPAAA